MDLHNLYEIENVSRARARDLLREAEMERLAVLARETRFHVSPITRFRQWLSAGIAGWRRARAHGGARTRTDRPPYRQTRLRRATDLVLMTNEMRPIVRETGTFRRASLPCDEPAK